MRLLRFKEEWNKGRLIRRGLLLSLHSPSKKQTQQSLQKWLPGTQRTAPPQRLLHLLLSHMLQLQSQLANKRRFHSKLFSKL